MKKTYDDFLARGVEFLGPPDKTHWGEFAVMKDSEGNRLILSPR